MRRGIFTLCSACSAMLATCLSSGYPCTSLLVRPSERRVAVVMRFQGAKIFVGLSAQVVSLRKYAKAFDLDISPTAPKEELTSAVIKHWNAQVRR